jgi:hypothetical protein
MDLVLNGFAVDADLARLMRRRDWPGKRIGAAWLERFPAHPCADIMTVPFVDLCAPERALVENMNIRRAELVVLTGTPDSVLPPGDFDPRAGYLIGFTDVVDSAICVD